MEDKAKETAGPVPAPSGAGIGLAAIARDMRERAEVAARHGERETCNASVAALLRHFADRVEEEAKAKEWAVASLLADNEALRALLVAPRRNCDLFRSEWDARRAFYHGYFGPTEEEFVNAAFIDWLFAPAEGKEASNG